MSAIPQTTEEIRAAVQARAIEIQGPAEEETTPQCFPYSMDYLHIPPH